MNDIAIHVSGLGKRYGLRESGGLATLWRGLRSVVKPCPVAPETGEEFWALKDVSFEIRRGEVVGVLGGNGAGKSTLLKVLSRITSPTEGQASINGQVGMLLEVGTGFHPDLSGRENVFLGGALLGMSPEEIRKQYDAIVDFADIRGFMNVPVRHYSSGMSLRLALSVAIHLSADIVFLDEVWAVGDQGFQNKSLQKIEALIRSGRTFIIVSHNMETIRRLCSRCLLFEKGRLVMDDSPDRAIEAYLGKVRVGSAQAVAVQSIHIESLEIPLGDVIQGRVVVESDSDISVSLALHDHSGQVAAVAFTDRDGDRRIDIPLPAGHNACSFAMQALVPEPGEYRLVVQARTAVGGVSSRDQALRIIAPEMTAVGAGIPPLPVLPMNFTCEEHAAVVASS